MIHLITGGSGSGKSAYGEDWLVSHREEGICLYVATMRPFGEETRKKILRHQEMRAGKRFETLEWYGENLEVLKPFYGGILLECMSNLLADVLYQEDGSLREEAVVKKQILQGIETLCRRTNHLVIITNEVHSDLQEYSEETKLFIRLLGELNQELARWANQVTEVVYGIPVKRKELCYEEVME